MRFWRVKGSQRRELMREGHREGRREGENKQIIRKEEEEMLIWIKERMV